MLQVFGHVKFVKIRGIEYLASLKHSESSYDFSFISKVLYILPSKLLIYGKHDKIAEKQLLNMGIDYRVYTDFHRLTKGVA